MMVEAGAKELPEELMLEAVRFGHEALQDIIKMQEKLAQAVNIAKRPFYAARLPMRNCRRRCESLSGHALRPPSIIPIKRLVRLL